MLLGKYLGFIVDKYSSSFSLLKIFLSYGMYWEHKGLSVIVLFLMAYGLLYCTITVSKDFFENDAKYCADVWHSF